MLILDGGQLVEAVVVEGDGGIVLFSGEQLAGGAVAEIDGVVLVTGRAVSFDHSPNGIDISERTILIFNNLLPKNNITFDEFESIFS
jgi:hypothetical protein